MRLLHWIWGALGLSPNPKIEETIRRLSRDGRLEREMAARLLDERDEARGQVDAYRHACGVPMGIFPAPQEAVDARVMREIDEAVRSAVNSFIPKETPDDATQ